MTEPARRPDARPVDALRSVVGAIAPLVQNLTLSVTANAPEWLRRMPIPDGWQLVQVDCGAVQPTRTAVCGERQAGGWHGCDTVSLYVFSGNVPPELIVQANSSTLLDLQAESVTTRHLAGGRRVSCDGGSSVGARSSGYLTLADRRMWAQYSSYYSPGTAPGAGVLLSHNLFIGADVRARLRDDIGDLSDTVHSAFLAATDTVDGDAPTSPLPVLRGE